MESNYEKVMKLTDEIKELEYRLNIKKASFNQRTEKVNKVRNLIFERNPYVSLGKLTLNIVNRSQDGNTVVSIEPVAFDIDDLKMLITGNECCENDSREIKKELREKRVELKKMIDGGCK